MLLRLALLSLIAVLFLGAAVTFEAATKTASALAFAQKAKERAKENAKESASQTASESLRARLVDRAAEELEESWARPTLWHAGASEALSGIYLQQALRERNAQLLDRSAALAARTVALSPVQPRAWTRLAALSEMGHAHPVCALDQCLERSFTVARMTDPDIACARLQIAYRKRLLRPDDPRLLDYLRSGASDEQIARCLSVAPPEVVFQMLMRKPD